MKKATLPDLIVIGAPKSATTSLHYYLGLHPQIFMSREKELDFFIVEGSWNRGIEWYRSNFDGSVEICGESSPKYSNFLLYAGVAERMRRILPAARLIYVVRDPIERMISQYVHTIAEGLETRPLSEALSNPDKENSYIGFSKYYMQLSEYLQYYPASAIFIVDSCELLNDRAGALKRIFQFLGVDENFHSSEFNILLNTSAEKRRKTGLALSIKENMEKEFFKRFPLEWRRKIGKLVYYPLSKKMEKPSLDDETLEKIKDRLRDDVEKFRKFTGNDFEHWDI